MGLILFFKTKRLNKNPKKELVDEGILFEEAGTGSWCFWRGAGQKTLFGGRPQIKFLHEIQGSHVVPPFVGLVLRFSKQRDQTKT